MEQLQREENAAGKKAEAAAEELRLHKMRPLPSLVRKPIPIPSDFDNFVRESNREAALEAAYEKSAAENAFRGELGGRA